MTKYIFHIADIHIHERNYAHIRHSWKTLIADITAVSNYTSQVILVIAGDIFDHKTYLTAGDVSLFYDMMEDIERSQINTIMMPGNHDYNINNSKDDKINALVERMCYKYIKYYSISAVAELLGVVFFIHSPIDQVVIRPNEQHVGKKTVALVHEPLSESKTCSGITFGQQRFAASDFTNIFDMTMMGDIHMPQLLAPNVAYSGSFVQKNRGEDIHHGYMKWDVATGLPTFVKINQLSLHIKIWARGNKMDDAPGVIARSVSLYYNNCDDEHIARFRDQLEMLYSRKVDVFNKTVIQTEDAVVDIQDVKDLSGTVVSNLVSMNLSENQSGRVSEMHASMFSESDHESGLDWRIRFLSWSNVYCYGENNYINFDEIGNLTSIIGANKMGKSSIIDIVMLVLFNQTSRGSKRHALHVDSTNGYIKCVITVGPDEYAIERAWIDKKTVIVRLYKNGENITNEDIVSTYKLIGKIVGSKRVFVNSTAALQQRQFIVDLGSKEIYELVCRMMDLDKLREIEDQNNIEIRHLKKQIATAGTKISGVNYKELLTEKKKALLALQILDKTMKDSIKDIQTRISLISVDLDDSAESANVMSDKLSLLTGYEKWDNENLLIKLSSDLASGRSETDTLQRDITRLSVQRDIMRSELRPVSVSINLADVTKQIKEAELINIDNCMLKVSSLTTDMTLMSDRIEVKQAWVKKADCELLVHKALIVQCRTPVEISDDSSCLSYIDLTEKENELSALRISLGQLEISLAVTRSNRNRNVDEHGASTDAEHVTAMTTFVGFSIENVEKERQLLKADLVNTSTLLADEQHNATLLMKQLYDKKIDISNAESIEGTQMRMEWNQECQCCTKNNNVFNMSILAADDSKEKSMIDDSALSIMDYKLKISNINIRLKQLTLFEICMGDARIAEIRAEHERVRIAIVDISDNITTGVANNVRMKALQEEAAVADSNAKTYVLIHSLTKEIDADKKIIEQWTEEVVRFKDELIKAREPINALREARVLKARYEDYIHNDSISSRLVMIDNEIATATGRNWCIKSQCGEWEKKVSGLVEFKTLHLQYLEVMNKWKIALSNEDAIDEIKELELEFIEMKKSTKEIDQLIGPISIDIGRYQQLIISEEEIKKEILSLEQLCSDRVIYDKIINHKTGVPEHMMKTMCSNIQARCNDILRAAADFEIEVIYDKEITINTVIGDRVVSAEQSSGYQKFIMDLILRQVLCSLTQSSHPRILFVDEGFGALDKDNFVNVCKVVLPVLAKHFEKVIIISHIQGIHDYTITDCVITKINERSHIQFGLLSFNGLKLRVKDDHEQHVSNIKEQKEAAKLINNAEKIRKQKGSQVDKEAEEKRLQARAEERQAEYGESIIESVDENTVRCMACKKTYRKRNGFARSHITGTAHMKCMRTFE